MNILNPVKKQFGVLVRPREQNKLIDAVNRLRKIQFDPKQFNVKERSDGMFISFRQQTSGLDLDNLMFWYAFESDPSSGSPLIKMRINPGEVHHATNIYTCAKTYLPIAADKTYVYLEMEFGTGLCYMKNTTVKNNTITSASCFRKVFYYVRWSTPNNLWLNTTADTPIWENFMGIAHMGGVIDITSIFS